MKLLVVCLLLVGGACAENNESEKLSAVLNDYIDNAIPYIVQFLIDNGLDPMEIPDYVASFEYKPLLITYHGKLHLSQGILTNIRSIHRSHDVVVHYSDKVLRIHGSLGLKDIEFTYNYLAKVMNIGPTGGIRGSMNSANIYVDMSIDFNTMELSLNQFYIYNVGRIRIRLTGNVIFDWLSNIIIRLMTAIFKDSILGLVESSLRDLLTDFINSINDNISLSRVLLDMELHKASGVHFGSMHKTIFENALKQTKYYVK